MSILILSSLAVGLAALIVIMSVMNSLQSVVIEQLRTIDTFNLEVTGITGIPSEEVISSLEEIDGISQVYPFRQTRGVVASATGSTSVLVRGVENLFFTESNPFTQRVFFDEYADRSLTEGAVVGFPLQNSLSIRGADSLTFTLLTKGKKLALTVVEKELAVSGVFSSPLKEVNEGRIYVPLSFLYQEGEEHEDTYGIFLDNKRINDGKEIGLQITSLFAMLR